MAGLKFHSETFNNYLVLFLAWRRAEWHCGGHWYGVQQRSNNHHHIQHPTRGQRHSLWYVSLDWLSKVLFLICDSQCAVSAYPTDLELYNEALKVIHDFPQYYPFEVAASGWRLASLFLCLILHVGENSVVQNICIKMKTFVNHMSLKVLFSSFFMINCKISG